MFCKIALIVALGSSLLVTAHAFGAAGAIAYSPSTKHIAWCFGSDDADAAQQAALNALSDSDKQIVSWKVNGWAVFAASEGAWGTASGDTRTDAEAAAIAACQQADANGATAKAAYIVFSGTDDEAGFAIEFVTTAELRMFYDMYGDAGLDSDTLGTLYQSWERASRTDRKSQFDDFKAKIQEIEDAETPVDIRIVNPDKFGVTWSYLMNGETMSLGSGFHQDLNRRCTIEFATGGDAGTKRYRLTDGVYTLEYDDDHWDLRKTADDLASVTPHDPVTEEEQKMFDAMYGDAGLDDDSLNTLKNGWQTASAAERQAQYADFEAKIKEVQESAAAHFRIVNPAANKVAWSFLIDDKQQTLAAGEDRDFQGKSTIKINLGGSAGEVEYSLSQGVYAFGADGGHWRFYQQATDANAIEDSPSHGDPITAAEQQMFQKMYGDAGLDADTVKTVHDGWEKLTSAERQSQYNDFEEKIKQVVEAATPVEIRIVNPASNKVSWSYLIDGKPHTLAAGAEQVLHAKATIRCNLGGDLGDVEYALTEGTFVFKSEDGRWRFAQRAEAAEAALAAEPVTPAEEQMFEEMYKAAGFDADTLKTVRAGWQNATAADRKAQYEKFSSAVKAASASAEKEAEAVDPVQKPEPVTASEQKLFDEMYKDAGLDPETLKLVTDAWKGSSSIQRKALYDQFMTKLKQASDDIKQPAAPLIADATPDPVTADERKLFDEMYGEVGLDAPTLEILHTGWKQSTHADRKKQHDDFMAKIAEAVHSVEKNGAEK